MSSVPTPEDDAAYRTAFMNKEVVVVGRLPLKLDRAQVEASFRENGIRTGTIFWALNRNGDPTAPHDGWCHLTSPTAEDTRKAIKILMESKIGPVPIIAYISPMEIKTITRVTRLDLLQPTPSTSTGGEDTIVADIDLANYRLRELPDSWIHDPENPGADEKAMFAHYKKLDAAYSQAGIKTRFRLWEDEEGNKGFHSIQRPRPLPADDDFAQKEYVQMLAPGLDEKGECQLVPLAEVKEYEDKGWTLWKCPEPPLNEYGRDFRRVHFPTDTIKYDRPHEDFERYWASEMEIVKKQIAPPNWKPGMPFNRVYDKEDNISTAKEFRPPSEWKQVVSGSSGGHYPIIRRPAGVGAGWGDYDKFTQWQMYGRRVTPDMVEDKKWNKKMTEIVLVDSEDPTKKTTIPIDESLNYLLPTKEPLTLFERLHKEQNIKGNGSKRNRNTKDEEVPYA
ncbi:hypothetical protein F5Y10DRAFT_286388 [Nemania abortiva]|nr:hypothetical protein F5Y10DRAFT_286388 [Nemania abortiva]